MTTLEIVAGGARVPVSADEPVTVPTGDVLLAVPSSHAKHVVVDGRKVAGSKIGETVVIPIDLTRSTGFHHVVLPPNEHFWIGTEDAKLGLDGITALVEYLRGEELQWSGQLLFSDGSMYRDAHVVYGWLDRHADEVVRAAERIVAQPRRSVIQVEQVSSVGGRRPVVKSSLALLRKGGTDYVEEVGPGTPGAVAVAGRSVFPRKIVRRSRAQTLDSVAHRRLAALLATVGRLLDEVIAAAPSVVAEERCKAWAASLARLTGTSFIRLLPRTGTLSPLPSVEEITDTRYSRSFALHSDLAVTLGWSTVGEFRPLYAYVRAADEIYQAFVAYSVASALGLEPAAAMLGSKQPSFGSAEWELYTNVVPPPDVLRSWRSYTAQPDDYRPDLVLRHRQTGRVVVLDAKYRDNGLRASESSRKDLMAYMGAYDAPATVIVYPAKPQDLVVGRMVHEDRTLYEVSAVPSTQLAQFLASALPPIIEAASFHPRWAD